MSRSTRKRNRAKSSIESPRWLPVAFTSAEARWAFVAVVLGVLVAMKDLVSPIVAWMELNSAPSAEDRLLAASNPTRVDVESVGIDYWDGLQDPFLTVTFKNSSRLRAHSIKVVTPSLLAMLKPPTATQQVMTQNVGLEGGDQLLLPVATMADVRRRVAESKPGYTIVGAGTKPNIPAGLALDLCGRNRGEDNRCDAEGASVFVPLSYRFTNPFREEVEVVTGMYLYAARLRSDFTDRQSMRLVGNGAASMLRDVGKR